MNESRIQHILIIDDSPEDRARIRAALLAGSPTRRYRFKEASDGEEGLKICKQLDAWPIDCVIIDVHMPGMGGPEFLKVLREPHDYPNLPVVVLTGSSLHKDAGEALQLGAQDYITKDAVYPSVLFRVVDNAIERHQLIRDLHESRKAADAASRAKTAMVGNISHELRTPMTAVIGLCDVLLDSKLTDDQRRLLGMVRDNGEYLVEIVNDLLDLSKMEAGSLELDPEVFSPYELLLRSVELMEVRGIDNETDLRLEIASEVPKAVFGDPVRLRQVLLNLVSNAIKFSPQGQVTIRAQSVNLEDNKVSLKLEVIDTGVGISKEHQETIFQPFVQIGQRGRKRTSGGTGLGLAICRRLVNMMGGELHVESEIDRGSTFSFTIPLSVADSSILAVNKSRILSFDAINDALKLCQLLVAEDTRSTRVLLQRMLQDVGAIPTLVENGQQLIDVYKEGHGQFTAIITDVQMPGMDGLEAVTELRKLGCRLPILVLTADAVNETREEAMRAGASDILTKPIDRNRLLSTLKHYCDKRECDE